MSSADRTKVVVVDDHPIMRNGLKDALEASGRLEVVGQAGDGEEAVRTAEELGPQVIVMDVMMPHKDGIDACREIMELLPDTRVLMLTASTEMDAVIEAVAAGATGYLQKYSQPDELVDAVLDVARGRIRMPEEAVKEVFAMVRRERRLAPQRASDELTALEQETLTLFAGGRSYTQIAEARGNSTVTIRNTLYRIQDKLGIKTKQELVVWAVRNGLLDDSGGGSSRPSFPGVVEVRELTESTWTETPTVSLAIWGPPSEKSQYKTRWPGKVSRLGFEPCLGVSPCPLER
ncbi:MAG: response regulator transcription factor [Dehalococcoidia bacterium]|nr:response regulator transcription factor [Dehalococcoidia bacterium]